MSCMKKQRPENASNFAKYELLSTNIPHTRFNYPQVLKNDDKDNFPLSNSGSKALSQEVCLVSPRSVFCQLTNSEVSPEHLDLRFSSEGSEENESVSENEEPVETSSQTQRPVEEDFDGK
jgi:hypothetical protein